MIAPTDLGVVMPGSTLRIPLSTFSAANGGALALTALAVGDIQVYKDSSLTPRASTDGYGVDMDFNGVVGVNEVTINLASNDAAGFYAAGSRYYVVVNEATVDGQTLRRAVATFTIGVAGAVLNTTLSAVGSQTSVTLASGPPDNGALNGCMLYFHDVASATQGGFAYVLNYVGSTKVATLLAAPSFTLAVGDNVSVMPRESQNVDTIATSG